MSDVSPPQKSQQLSFSIHVESEGVREDELQTANSTNSDDNDAAFDTGDVLLSLEPGSRLAAAIARPTSAGKKISSFNLMSKSTSP